MYIYGHMKNGDTKLQQVEKQQKDFRKELNEITSGNPKHKSNNQLYVIENVKSFYNSIQRIIDLLNDNSKIRSEAIYKSKENKTTGTGLKILYRNLSQYLNNLCVSVFIMQSNLNFGTDIFTKDTHQIPENQISVTESLRNNISNYATVLTKKDPICMSCLFCLTKKH